MDRRAQHNNRCSLVGRQSGADRVASNDPRISTPHDRFNLPGFIEWAPEKRSKVFSQNLSVTPQRLGKSSPFCSGFTTPMTRPQSNSVMLLVPSSDARSFPSENARTSCGRFSFGCLIYWKAGSKRELCRFSF